MERRSNDYDLTLFAVRALRRCRRCHSDVIAEQTTRVRLQPCMAASSMRCASTSAGKRKWLERALGFFVPGVGSA